MRADRNEGEANAPSTSTRSGIDCPTSVPPSAFSDSGAPDARGPSVLESEFARPVGLFKEARPRFATTRQLVGELLLCARVERIGSVRPVSSLLSAPARVLTRYSLARLGSRAPACFPP